MRIAIVGGGVSGLTAAYILSREHEVALFESNGYIGGHTHTHSVQDANGRSHQVDSGFIVFNDRTYPNFVRLLDQLGVESQPSRMSFSFRCEQSGMEYSGSSLSGLFAQRRNLLRPGHLRMLKDIFRFYRQARRTVRAQGRNGDGNGHRSALLPSNGATTVGQFLAANRYSGDFVRRHLLPISASIWSADPRRIEDFPVHFMLRFFYNHGMLDLGGRPQWKVIKGGSARYVERLIRPFRSGIRLNSPVTGIRRFSDRAEVKALGREWEAFDHVVIAAHSNQALRMLEDPSRAEREVLGAIGYQANDAVLHTDRRVMPRRKAAWAGWNYHLVPQSRRGVAITYHMNTLQSLNAGSEFCVTLNRPRDVDPSSVLRRLNYEHPIYTPRAIEAQSEHRAISGTRRTHYCGAYWGYGFHEDGVKSALRVCQAFGMSL